MNFHMKMLLLPKQNYEKRGNKNEEAKAKAKITYNSTISESN